MTIIIRTVGELEALNPDTVILSEKRELDLAGNVTALLGRGYSTPEYQLPAVVIATGEQVRAAQQALEKEQE